MTNQSHHPLIPQFQFQQGRRILTCLPLTYSSGRQSMAGHSSLTTSRLAALSLSPSRIAQLGVKNGSRGSSENGDPDTSDHGKRNGPLRNGTADGKDGQAASTEGKRQLLNVPKPEMERRSSGLDSLSDEDDDDTAEGNAAEAKDTNSIDGPPVEVGRTDGVENGKEVPAHRYEQETPSAEGSAQSHVSANDVPSTTNASSSRQRSPPPSYDFAILPSALHHSASASTSTKHDQNDDSEPMSARRRGKQRDMRDSGRGDAPGHWRAGHTSGAMLELLENSDTSGGEDAFPPETTRSSPPRSPRRDETRHSQRQHRPAPSPLLTPQLGKPSTARRKRPAILASTTRSRSSYTGPVEMIDRSGEGWAESIADEETPAVEGYDMSSAPDTPTRPVLVSSTSSFIRALPSPSSGAFTQDVRIIGWKIVGGRSKFPRDGEGRGRGLWSDTAGREHDSGVEDVQKPGIGAYVGTSLSCIRPEPC